MPRFIEGQDRHQVTLMPECLDDFIAEDNTVRIVMSLSVSRTWWPWASTAQARRQRDGPLITRR